MPPNPDPTISAPEPSTRVGSNADLARRMDKMESRQDNTETELRNLSATVQRVEQNQSHAVELNKLRFDALDTGLKSVGGQLSDFIRKIDGILSGEIETIQTRQGQAIVADFMEWRKSIDSRLNTVEDKQDSGEARSAGRLDTLTWAKASLLLALAALPGIVTIIAFLSK